MPYDYINIYSHIIQEDRQMKTSTGSKEVSPKSSKPNLAKSKAHAMQRTNPVSLKWKNRKYHIYKTYLKA